MPLPPPPITALIIMGYYIISAYINFRIFINFIFDKKKFNINLYLKLLIFLKIKHLNDLRDIPEQLEH